MALVSLDTMVMAWMLRKKATPGQEFRLIEAEKLLQWIEADKHRVILTATAVGEYLVGLDDSQRKAELSSLRKNFHIQPYDAVAAALAAEIQTKVNIKAISAGSPGLYHCIKADVEIIATSIIGQAQFFVSCDGHFKTINAARILVKTTEEIAKEMDDRRDAEEKAAAAADAAKAANAKTLFPEIMTEEESQPVQAEESVDAESEELLPLQKSTPDDSRRADAVARHENLDGHADAAPVDSTNKEKEIVVLADTVEEVAGEANTDPKSMDVSAIEKPQLPKPDGEAGAGGVESSSRL